MARCSMLRMPWCMIQGRTEHSLWGSDEVGGLLVAELHRVAEHVDVQQLPDILLLVILCADPSHACQPGLRHPSVKGEGVRDHGRRHRDVLLVRKAYQRGLLSAANFLRIFPSSLSTRTFSASLLPAARISEMKFCSGGTASCRLTPPERRRVRAAMGQDHARRHRCTCRLPAAP